MRKLLLPLGALGLLGACAFGPQVKPDELAKVRTVAIVGFEVVQQQPKDLEISLGGSIDDGMPPIMIAKTPVPSKHAENIYDIVRKSFQKDFAWSVKDSQILRKNNVYQTLLKEKTTGLRSLPPVAANIDVFNVAGVMDWWAWEKMSPEERRKVISALNTDAVLVVRARSELKEGFSFKKLYGGGNFSPQVTFGLKLYGRDGEDVFWSDYNIQGEPTEKSVGHFAGISKREALDKLVVEAADIASKHFKASQAGGKK